MLAVLAARDIADLGAPDYTLADLHAGNGHVGAEVDLGSCPDRAAFSLFTDGIGTWWPPDHHILQGELAEMVFEPRVGGHVYDRGVDGSECRWARVLVYEPPTRVVFSWDINTSWQIETDPEKTSEVEVRFTAEGPDRTYVELEHRHLHRHGEGWEQMRDAVGAPNGWDLQPFADAVDTAAAAGG